MTFVVGVGLRAGTPYDELRTLVDTALDEAGVDDVQILTTSTDREHEPAVQQLAADLNAELVTFPSKALATQPVPTPSKTVDRLAGTPSVAEAAVLRTGATLLVPKRRSATVTVAVGRRPPAAEPLELSDSSP